MGNVKVALLQLCSCASQEDNLKKGEEYCRSAKAMGAHIALFPEMWNNGYAVSDDADALKQSSVDENSDFVLYFRNLARELDMAIGITFLESYEPLPRNTLCLFDRFGNRALKYSKVHTCDFGSEKNLTPGDDFYVTDLDVGNDVIKVGAMICYDREFPESARILMLKGAEIILVSNACPMEINRLSQLRARAFENMLGIATANYAYGQPDCNGHSSAFDGVVYREDESGSRDTLVIEAGEAEGIYMADFPIDEMRRYRAEEVHGNAYRRPKKYGLLTSEEINEPFVREDYRK
ncbi:MAG: carbon-nitrogen hydrolase family protein [Clostridia bacterium]